MEKNYLKDIDKWIAFVGLITSPILAIFVQITFNNPVYTSILVLVGSAFLLYILIIRSNISSNSVESIESRYNQRTASLILYSVFFLVYCIAVMVYYFSVDYERPIPFFFLVGLMSGLIAAIIVRKNSSECSTVILVPIGLVAVLLTWSVYFLYPSLIGIDPYYHAQFTESLIDWHGIPEGEDYSDLPIFHLIIAATSFVIGTDYKMSTILAIIIPQIVCGILFVYLLGQRLFNRSIALLATLVLVVSNRFIQMGFWPIPTTIAVIYVLIILYILYKMSSSNNGQTIPFQSLIVLLIMGTLTLTHTLTAMWMAILLWTLAVTHYIYSVGFQLKKNNYYFSAGILFSAMMIGWWTYGSGHLTNLAEYSGGSFDDGKFAVSLPESFAYVGYVDQLYNNLGMYIFFALSIIGCLYLLSERGNRETFLFAIGGFTTLGITFFGFIFQKYIIIGRWQYFSYLILAIACAIGIYLIHSQITGAWREKIFTISSIFLLTLLMITSQNANFDNPPLPEMVTERYAFTLSEIQTVSTIERIIDGKIYTDSYYTLLGLKNANYIDGHLYHKSSQSLKDAPIVLRYAVIDQPIAVSGYKASIKLDYNPEILLIQNQFDRIYQSSSVGVYLG